MMLNVDTNKVNCIRMYVGEKSMATEQKLQFELCYHSNGERWHNDALLQDFVISFDETGIIIRQSKGRKLQTYLYNVLT